MTNLESIRMDGAGKAPPAQSLHRAFEPLVPAGRSPGNAQADPQVEEREKERLERVKYIVDHGNTLGKDGEIVRSPLDMFVEGEDRLGSFFDHKPIGGQLPSDSTPWIKTDVPELPEWLVDEDEVDEYGSSTPASHLTMRNIGNLEPKEQKKARQVFKMLAHGNYWGQLDEGGRRVTKPVDLDAIGSLVKSRSETAHDEAQRIAGEIKKSFPSVVGSGLGGTVAGLPGALGGGVIGQGVSDLYDIVKPDHKINGRKYYTPFLSQTPTPEGTTGEPEGWTDEQLLNFAEDFGQYWMPGIKEDYPAVAEEIEIRKNISGGEYKPNRVRVGVPKREPIRTQDLLESGIM